MSKREVVIFWSAFAFIMIPLWYWIIVVNIAVAYLDEHNETRLFEIMYRCRGDQRKSDSCRVIADDFLKKSDNTRLWLPKAVRNERENYKN